MELAEETESFNFDPFNSPDREDPYPTLARARADYPIFFSEGTGTWVMTRYDDIVATLRDPERFSSRASITPNPGPPPAELLEVLAAGIPYVPNSVDLDPPDHTKFRRIVTKAFTPRRINGMEPEMRRLASELIDGFIADGEADIISQFAYQLPTLVIGGILGVPSEDMDRFKHWSDEWLVFLGSLGDMERLKVAAAAVVEFQMYVKELVEDRRANPQDDLTSVIVAEAAEDEEPFGDEVLVAMIMTIMFAGHETTTSLITNTLKQLLRHPEQAAEVMADRSLLPAAIRESLRFDPPVSGMYRTANTDVEVAGVALPAGSHIWLNFASANRDENHFVDPDTFDIHRTDAQGHLSFGQGIHFCIGSALSQLEGRTALDVIFDRMPSVTLDPEHVIEPVVTGTVRGTKSVRILWDAS